MNNVASLPNQPDLTQTESKVWSKSQLEQIEAHGALVEDVNKSRKALNDRISASKSELVAIGFNKDALAAAHSYAQTPEKDRLNWDETYIFARRAYGCPIQEDLFMAAMKDDVTVTLPTEKKDDDD